MNIRKYIGMLQVILLPWVFLFVLLFALMGCAVTSGHRYDDRIVIDSWHEFQVGSYSNIKKYRCPYGLEMVAKGYAGVWFLSCYAPL